MSRKSLLIVAGIMGFACFAIRPVPSAPTQLPDGSHDITGRYQVAMSSGNNAMTITVIDTQTGHCWFKQLGLKKWIDAGSPFDDDEKTDTKKKAE